MQKSISSLLVTLLISVYIFAADCKRTVTIISPNEMKVELTLEKKNISGLARLVEYIPSGSEIRTVKTEGGTYNIENNSIKFFWMTLPEVDTIAASYILSSTGLTQGNYSISGKFSFVEGTERKELSVDSSAFFISANNELKLPNTTIEIKNTATISKPDNTGSAKTSPVTNKPETITIPTQKKENTPPAVSTTSPGKVTYAIQVASTQTPLPDNYFATKYNIKEKAKYVIMNGLYKYTLGEFDNLNTANTFRETLDSKGLKGSFPVAFLNDKRISLGEAKKIEEAK